MVGFILVLLQMFLQDFDIFGYSLNIFENRGLSDCSLRCLFLNTSLTVGCLSSGRKLIVLVSLGFISVLLVSAEYRVLFFCYKSSRGSSFIK